MSQKSEDSVEQFFRKAVVQQDKTFMERDWQSMEKMLDAEDAVFAAHRAAKVRKIIKVSALSLVIASLFIVGIESQTISKFVQVQAAEGMVGPRMKVKTETPTADLHSSGTTEQETEEIVEKKQSSSRNRSSTSTNIAGSVNAEGETIQKISMSIDQPNASKFLQSQGSEADASEIIVPIKNIDRDEAKVVALTGSPDLSTNLTSTSSLHETPTEGLVSLAKQDSVVKGVEANPIQKVEEKSEQEGEEENSASRAPRLVVTGLISPDFSSTSLTKYSKPSGVFGVLLGYRISKRFTLMAGVTKGLKKYEGYGNEYSPPAGYWENRTNGVVPDEVEGQCGIVEVPLMVQFDLVQRLKSRIFVSTGVSSYFMRSENYEYTFSQPNPGAANSWTAKEPTRYLFKIGHLSAGYDRMLTRNLSLGIEPFLKVPFEGIGWTDINLYSTGAYINLRYTILRTHQ